MKGKQAFLYCAIALSLVAGLTGCKDDSAAVSALEELTSQLSDQVAEQNTELSALSEQLQTCVKDLATAKGEAVVIEAGDATTDAPSLEGEVSLESLGALKEALNETIEKQQGALAELKGKSEQCAKDLQTVQEAAEAAAAAEAEAAKAAAAKRQTTKKPTAVKEAEKTGAPTKGTRSRY